MTEFLKSNLDNVTNDGWVSGWAQRTDKVSEPLSLEITIDDLVVGKVIADKFRSDLYTAGFEQPNCAFWFKLPTDYLCNGRYSVGVRLEEGAEPISGSPYTVMLGSSKTGISEKFNFIPNATFTHWPHGLIVDVTKRFQETAAGWLIDFKCITEPKLSVAAVKPTGMGLRPNEYAIQITVNRKNEGYLHLIAPLNRNEQRYQNYNFACSIRRPLTGTASSLSCVEIFLGFSDGRDLTKVALLRENFVPQGTVRINIPVPIDPDFFVLARERNLLPAIVISLKGTGELIISSPYFGSIPHHEIIGDVLGRFEDDNIVDQVRHLQLSPIWTSDDVVLPRLCKELPPAPAIKAPRHVASGLPFTEIVVPVFNAASDVSELLDSIIACTHSPFAVLLADDGSNPFTLAQNANWLGQDPRIRSSHNTDNLGYTRNINIALHSTTSEFVLLINSDTIVSPRWLDKMLAVMLSDPNTAAVGPLSNAASWQSIPMTKKIDGSWAINALPPGMTVADMGKAVERVSCVAYPSFPILNGFCTLFRRSALEEVGFFDDENFPLGYGEENDLCLRLGHAGWTLRVADNTYIYHKKSRSFGIERRLELSQKASKILRAKHPEIIFPMLEENMRVSAPLIQLRRDLVRHLAIEGIESIIYEQTDPPFAQDEG